MSQRNLVVLFKVLELTYVLIIDLVESTEVFLEWFGFIIIISIINV